MIVTSDKVVFRSAYEALQFAFNVSAQAYDRPLMNRMADKMKGGDGLHGLDAAAQAGMIRAQVKALGKVSEAILTARFAPDSQPCTCGSPCCSKNRINIEWREAIGAVADHMRLTALRDCSTDSVLRSIYVTRYFTPKDKRVSMLKISKEKRIQESTAQSHYNRVAASLGGSKSNKIHVDGLEQSAMNRLEAKLKEIGVVDDTDA